MKPSLPSSLNEPVSLQIVSEFFKDRGFTCLRIVSSALSGQSPDLEVQKSGILMAYLEVKTLEYIPDQETGLFLFRTQLNKLKDRSSKAGNQLSQHDPSRKTPRIVTFISNNLQLNWFNFAHLLQGVVGGKRIQDTQKKLDLKRAFGKVEAFIWMQTSPEGQPHQITFFVNKTSPLYLRIKKLVDALTPLNAQISCTKLHKACSQDSHYSFLYNPELLDLSPWS